MTERIRWKWKYGVGTADYLGFVLKIEYEGPVGTRCVWKICTPEGHTIVQGVRNTCGAAKNWARGVARIQKETLRSLAKKHSG
jgi:hypothetical protein